MNEPFIDSIIRIKNSAVARRRDVLLPYAKLVKAIGGVLVKEQFLDEVVEEIVDGKKMLRAKIRYERRQPLLTGVSVVSKPSLREYISAKDIAKRERKELHTLILSTNKGVMTGKEARSLCIGGELLLEVW